MRTLRSRLYSPGSSLKSTAGRNTSRIARGFLSAWATLYDGVGSVKRHLEFTSREGSFFSSYLKNLFSFLHFDQGSLRESSGGNWFHQPSMRSPLRGTMILSSDAAIARGSKAPNQPSDGLASTRVAPGLPCLRTSCA